jgi:hypothetical protein
MGLDGTYLGGRIQGEEKAQARVHEEGDVSQEFVPDVGFARSRIEKIE